MHRAFIQESSAKGWLTGVVFRRRKSRLWPEMILGGLPGDGQRRRCDGRSGRGELMDLLGELGHLCHQRLDSASGVRDALLLLIHTFHTVMHKVRECVGARCFHVGEIVL